jgi:hypothetical protein
LRNIGGLRIHRGAWLPYWRRHEAALKLSNEQLQLALDGVEQSKVRLLDALAAGQVIAFEWNVRTRQSRAAKMPPTILGPKRCRASDL